MRTVLTLTLLVVLTALPAFAGEREPTPAELATMLLNGTPGEHVLVAAWLEKIDRAEVAAVFRALRTLKARGAAARRPGPEIELTEIAPPSRPSAFKPPAGEKHTLINAEVHFIDVPADAAAAFLGKQRPSADRMAVALTAVEAAALMRAVEQRADVKLVHAPRITVYDGQKANVSVLNEISYVQDFHVEEAKDGTKIADPVVQTIQEGTVIDFQPSLARHGKSIGLRFNGTFAAVTRPIPTLERELPGSPGRTVKVQIPELRVLRLKTTVYVPNGGWVLIGGGILLEPKKGASVERVTLVHLKTL